MGFRKFMKGETDAQLYAKAAKEGRITPGMPEWQREVARRAAAKMGREVAEETTPRDDAEAAAIKDAARAQRARDRAEALAEARAERTARQMNTRTVQWDGRVLTLRGKLPNIGGPREIIKGAWGNADARPVRGEIKIPAARIATVGTHLGWMQVHTVDGREYLANAPAAVVEAIAEAIA